MSYANRSALEADIAAWLDRADIVANIPGFISNAEANFNRTLRVQRMIHRASAQTDQQFVELPADFLEMERVAVVGAGYDLIYTPPMQVDATRTGSVNAATGSPRFYSISGNAVELLPPPTSGTLIELGLFYYQRIPALANGDETNWLLASEPDLYLFGSLMQSAPFLKYDERLPVWEKLLAGSLGQIVMADKRMRRGTAAHRVRPGAVMP